MARRRKKYVVPGIEQEMQAFKSNVMKREGYTVDPNRPNDVKYEVAKELGIPLHPQNMNPTLTKPAISLVLNR